MSEAIFFVGDVAQVREGPYRGCRVQVTEIVRYDGFKTPWLKVTFEQDGRLGEAPAWAFEKVIETSGRREFL